MEKCPVVTSQAPTSLHFSFILTRLSAQQDLELLTDLLIKQLLQLQV